MRAGPNCVLTRISRQRLLIGLCTARQLLLVSPLRFSRIGLFTALPSISLYVYLELLIYSLHESGRELFALCFSCDRPVAGFTSSLLP